MNKMAYSFDGLNLASEAKPGMVSLANEASFNQQFFSEPLTQYAVGWTSDQKALEKLLDFVAPQVSVSRKFQYKVANNAKEFLALEETDDVRALGGEFRRIEARGDIVQSRTYSKGLSTIIDLDEEDAEDGLEERKVAWLRRILLRMEIRRAVALLSGAATNKAVTWGGTAGTDPDMDLAEMLLAGGDNSGIDPNRVLMGKSAWQSRLVALRAKDTAGAFASAGMTPEQLAGFLACDQVYVNTERFQSGSAKQNLVGSNVILGFMAEQGQSKDDPSNIKRFVSAQDGGPFRVFRQELTSHLIQISVSHYSNIVLTSNLGLRKLTVTKG